MELLDDGAWVAAIAAPWTIAPHPNFSEDRVSGPGLLALVAQFRIQDLYRYQELMPEGQAPWVIELIDASRRSIEFGTVRSGADDLWGIALREDVSIGGRVASAMFATVAEVELDELGAAHDRLTSLAREVEQGMPSTRTAELALAVLRMQIASRQFEQLDYQGADETLQKIKDLTTLNGQWGQFDVSLGIGWDSIVVQEDIYKALSSHKLELRSRIEGFKGNTWVDVVKSRSSWPEFRGAVVSAARDRKYVEEVYERKVGARVKRRTIRNTDPVLSRALEALLVAELTGDVNGFMAGRLALGQFRILRDIDKADHPEVWPYQDALRLFRKARAKESLQRVLDSIYLQGPDDALINDASLILQRGGFPRDVTSYDLMVLGGAAQYLSSAALQRSVDAALAFVLKPNSVPGSEPADQQIAWRAILRLLPESGKDEAVAQASLLAVQGSYDLIEGELLQLFDALNWDAVEPRTIAEWNTWGSQAGESEREIATRARFLGKPSERLNMMQESPEWKLPLYLAMHKNEISNIPSSLIARAEAVSSNALGQIREEAQHGSTSFGGFDAGEVAVALATEFGLNNLWSKVTELLADRKVPQELKEKAMRRIAEAGVQHLPEKAEKSLRSHWKSILESSRHDIFSEPDPRLEFADALRVGTILKVLSRDDAVAAGTNLAGSQNPENKLAACELIGDVASVHGEWTWAQIMLLQLIHDPDLNVRPPAAKTLASIGENKTAVTPLVVSALKSCLTYGGIRLPLLTLHGLQRSASKARELGPELVTTVQDIAMNHRARVVREAARYVVDARPSLT